MRNRRYDLKDELTLNMQQESNQNGSIADDENNEDCSLDGSELDLGDGDESIASSRHSEPPEEDFPVSRNGGISKPTIINKNIVKKDTRPQSAPVNRSNGGKLRPLSPLRKISASPARSPSPTPTSVSPFFPIPAQESVSTGVVMDSLGTREKSRPTFKDPETLLKDSVDYQRQIRALEEDKTQLKTRLYYMTLEIQKKDKQMEDIIKSTKVSTVGSKSASETMLVANLKQKIRELEMTLDDKVGELKAIRSDVRYTRVNELELESRTYLNETVRLQQILQTQEATLHSYYKNHNKEMEEAITHYKEKCSKYGAAYTRKKDQLKQLTADYNASIAHSKKLESKISTLKAQVEDFMDKGGEKVLDELKSKLQDNEQLLKEYEQKIEDLANDREKLTSELEEERTKTGPLEEEKSKYQDMYAQEREERENDRQEIERLQRELQFKFALSGATTLEKAHKSIIEDKAATKIQKTFKGHAARKDFEVMKRAIVIQCAVKGFLARKKYQKAREQKKAAESATKIQASFRGSQQRQKYKQSKQAATKIQATFRGHKVRNDKRKSDKIKEQERKEREANEIAEEVEAEDEVVMGEDEETEREVPAEEKEENHEKPSEQKQESQDYQAKEGANEAATKIQSLYRGYHTRKDLKLNLSGIGEEATKKQRPKEGPKSSRTPRSSRGEGEKKHRTPRSHRGDAKQDKDLERATTSHDVHAESSADGEKAALERKEKDKSTKDGEEKHSRPKTPSHEDRPKSARKSDQSHSADAEEHARPHTPKSSRRTEAGDARPQTPKTARDTDSPRSSRPSSARKRSEQDGGSRPSSARRGVRSSTDFIHDAMRKELSLEEIYGSSKQKPKKEGEGKEGKESKEGKDKEHKEPKEEKEAKEPKTPKGPKAEEEPKQPKTPKGKEDTKEKDQKKPKEGQKDEAGAAVVIQSTYRGYQTRKDLAAKKAEAPTKKEEKPKEEPPKVEKKEVRIEEPKKEEKKEKKEEIKPAEQPKKEEKKQEDKKDKGSSSKDKDNDKAISEDAAATKIQALAKGHKARKEFKAKYPFFPEDRGEAEFAGGDDDSYDPLDV